MMLIDKINMRKLFAKLREVRRNDWIDRREKGDICYKLTSGRTNVASSAFAVASKIVKERCSDSEWETYTLYDCDGKNLGNYKEEGK